MREVVVRDDALLPTQSFGFGMALGVLLGFAVGSLLAVRLGAETLNFLREGVARLLGRRNRVNFELLLQ